MSSSFSQLARLIRLPNTFTVVSNVLAASMIASQMYLNLLDVLLLISISMCLYHGGMILNDCLDVEEDKQSRPSRPIPSGAIPLHQAWIASIALFVLGLSMAWHFGLHTFAVSCALLVSIVTYNVLSREKLIGCVVMGLCRSLNWLMVLAAFDVMAEYAHFALFVGLYVVALTLFSRDETQANRKGLAYVAMAILVCSAIGLLLVLQITQAVSLLTYVVVAAGLALLLYKIIKLQQDYTPANIQAMVMTLVLGLIPIDAALTLMAGYPLAALLIVALIVPSKILAKRFYVT